MQQAARRDFCSDPSKKPEKEETSTLFKLMLLMQMCCFSYSMESLWTMQIEPEVARSSSTARPRQVELDEVELHLRRRIRKQFQSQRCRKDPEKRSGYPTAGLVKEKKSCGCGKFIDSAIRRRRVRETIPKRRQPRNCGRNEAFLCAKINRKRKGDQIMQRR